MNIEAIQSLLDAGVQFLVRNPLLSSPLTFAGLAGIAVAFFWFALAPSTSEMTAAGRIRGYLDRQRDIIEELELRESFWRRAVLPVMRGILKTLGALTPWRDVSRVQTLLVYAGNPGGLTAADVFGLQILAALFLGGIYVLGAWLLGAFNTHPWPIIVRNSAVGALIGFILPRLWLRGRARRRQRAIVHAFSDALDLLSVSVDAGLGFDQAMQRVSEHWENPLTEEFRRALLEMQVGTPRNEALQRMADRTGVEDVQTFVGVLIQSSELGVSIARTLHEQAAQVRLRRRQRAEELARVASIKMVFALVFLIFPALLVVLLGPGIPRIFEALGGAFGW